MVDEDESHTPTGQWKEFQEHLEKIPAVQSFSLLEDSDMAKVYVDNERGHLSVGRELFTRVAHMGFIVAEINGHRNEIKFINILGEHNHYLPDELNLVKGEDESVRTPEEQQVLDQMTEKRGEDFVEENEELILAEARLIGDL